MALFVFEPSQYPGGPGCYLMRDAAGAVLYVGKAKNLRKRLASHFRRTGRNNRVLAGVGSVEVILVNNETEALILEHNLIKRYQPSANRVLLDPDEGYFYIALTAEELPRLVAYRRNRINKDLERAGTATAVARCFGPYVNRRFRDALLAFVNDQFQIRTCAPLPKQVCLRYDMGACGGVCARHVSSSDYSRAVADAVGFLSRPHIDVIRHMRRQMKECADALQYERASWIKHHVQLLEGALERQMVERDVHHDQDVLHFEAGRVLVLRIKRGVLLGCDTAELAGQTPGEFLFRRYHRESPAELIVNHCEDVRGIEQRLIAATGSRVRVTLLRSRRGIACQLMQLAAKNHAYRIS